jgi:uncharacterized protein
MPKPIPVGDALTAPFWDHVNHRRLAIQRCQLCRLYYHPPVAACYDCQATELAYELVSGRGTIYSFTITYDARQPAFQAIQPYPVAIVELEEQAALFLLTNMPGTRMEDVNMGAAVEVEFEELAEGHLLPQFRLAARAGHNPSAGGGGD